MSVRKLTARFIGSLVVLCGLVTSAQAQQHAPVADPFEFDPDWRWFEPIYGADLADMKPKHRANTGWFATYDRLYLYGSRPDVEGTGAEILQGEAKMDTGWGHRYEIGYMLPDKDQGWLFSWHEHSVVETDTVRHYALNLVNLDELGGEATNPGPPFGWEAIPEISNNLGYNNRFTDVDRTLNQVKFDSYELSKTWRMEPYHYGGMLEPMLGIRWFRIKDTFGREDYTNSQIFLHDNGPLIPDPGANLGAQVEILRDTRSVTENEAFTGQLGFRYFKYHQRFLFSTDFRCFAGHNWQCNKARVTEVVTVYDGTDVGIGDEVDNILRPNSGNTFQEFTRNDEFFIGFDVRADLAYQLTKAITIRSGFQCIDIETGLWRGSAGNLPLPVGRRDQDLLLIGATFGVTLNR